jgi:hypothetical protein
VKLQPADIRLKWDWIKPKLEAMFAGSRERPEELYAACRYGHATLYTSDDAFVVFEPQIDRSTGETAAFVWAFWCDTGSAVERYTPQLIEIAKSGGAARLVGVTFHDALARHYEAQGYVKASTTHERSI